MCKLVGIPEYIEPFLPLLAPGVEKVMKETPDPEVRSVAERSYNVLMKSAGTDPERYAALVKAKEEAREAAKAAAKAAAAAAKKGGAAAKGKGAAAAAAPAAGAGVPAVEELEKTVADIAREKEAAILAGLVQELHTALGAAALESVRAAPPAPFDMAVKYVATLAQVRSGRGGERGGVSGPHVSRPLPPCSTSSSTTTSASRSGTPTP